MCALANSSGGRRIIGLKEDERPGDHQRFSLAHELEHFGLPARALSTHAQ